MIYFILSIKRNFLKKKISNFPIIFLIKTFDLLTHIIPSVKKYVSM